MSELSRDEPGVGVRYGSRGLEAQLTLTILSQGWVILVSVCRTMRLRGMWPRSEPVHIDVMRIVGSNTHG